MNYRTTKILAEETLTETGTKVIDINIKEPISRIDIAYRVTKGQNGMDSYCHRDITKIELVDGSDVLHSLNGGQNQALCIYDRKVQSMNKGVYIDANSQKSNYGIDFGRFLYDPLLAFDPTRFRNPQLKITYDVDVSDTAAETAYVEVLGHIFDEKVISPVGFLMAKEHFSYTLAGTGYEYISLPTDYVLRKLLVQGYLSAFEPWYTLAEARLDEDNEKRIPFDWDLEDYLNIMMGKWTQIQERLQGYVAGGGSLYHFVTPTSYFVQSLLMTTKASYPIFLADSVNRGGRVYVSCGEGASISGWVFGYLPNHCFEFPFGDERDPEDWYDITKLGSLRLRLKGGSGGSSNGTGAVVLQQLRRY